MSRRLLQCILPTVLVGLALVAAPASARGLSTDQTFVTATAGTNTFETRSGQLAQQRAESEQVRDFAAMLVADHTAQQAQLEAAAQRLGLNAAPNLGPFQALALRRLQGLSGAAFDRAFLRAQVAGHIIAITTTTGLIADPRLDDELAALGIAASPILIRHLREANQLLAAVTG